MNPFRSSFKGKRAFLPVIHAETEDQVLRNARIAKNAGADGVFLINHRISIDTLIAIYESVRKALPDFWIGLNFLGLTSPIAALSLLPEEASGLWVDNAGIIENAENPVATPAAFDTIRKKNLQVLGWNWIYFGGVAFKYQPAVKNLAKAVQCALPYVDVITTSGEGTGTAPSVEKIRIMKEACGDHPLAVASGLTAKNISGYDPPPDAALVSTGISLAPSRPNDLCPDLAYEFSEAYKR